MVRGSDDSQNVGYEKALNMSDLSIILKISRWNKKIKKWYSTPRPSCYLLNRNI